jgi:hypothetical protein
MILVNGDSFTAGEESPIAWPELIPNTVNIAQSGASNDYICRSTVNYIENLSNKVNAVIIAWTSPNRIELGHRHITPTSQRKYGNLVDTVYEVWDEWWAYNKFISQVKMMAGYLKSQGMPFLFVSTFDIQNYKDNKAIWRMPEEYLGWPNEGIVEWMGDCPKGQGGHPLEQGHIKIALKINEHIGNLGWLS